MKPLTEKRKEDPPSGKGRKWLAMAIVGLSLLVVLPPLLFAERNETNWKCPLTGKDRVVVEWLGLTWSDQISANDVSRWAEANSIQGVAPGKCGWEFASNFSSRWLSPTRIGCGDPHLIPYRIHQGSLASPGGSREELLRNFQKHLQTALAANKPLFASQQAFLSKLANETPE